MFNALPSPNLGEGQGVWSSYFFANAFDALPQQRGAFALAAIIG